MANEWEPTGEDLARMETQAVLSFITEVTESIEKLLVRAKYYNDQIGPADMEEVLRQLEQIKKNFS